MRGVNKVILIGNLGKDPDIQYLEGNIPVSKFPLATTETYKDKTGKLISQTEWHNIVLWRGLAELAQKYLHKSSLVYIEGRLKTRYWEDRDHNKKWRLKSSQIILLCLINGQTCTRGKNPMIRFLTVIIYQPWIMKNHLNKVFPY